MTTIITRAHPPEGASILASPPLPKLDRKFYRNGEIFYPDSDGEPVANNTKHLEYIDATKYGLEQYFQANEDVFVAADLLWYPMQGYPNICSAPDVMLAFGRPKGARGSYKQWEEGGTAPQVVFEFLSASNTPKEMMRKSIFFEHYGVQEYYLYDIEMAEFTVFMRSGAELAVVETDTRGWVSPLLGLRFEIEELHGPLELLLYKPDGERFRTYPELIQMGIDFDAMKAELRETTASLAQKNIIIAQQDQQIRALQEKLRLLGIA